MSGGEQERLVNLISAAADGAGSGVAALRQAGVAVALEDFAVEVTVDSEAVSATLRIAFAPAPGAVV